MRRAVPLFLVLVLAGCKSAEIPEPPAEFYTVVLTSSLNPDKLYAEGLAVFLRAGWSSVTPTEAGLTATILPDGAENVPLAVRVEAGGAGSAVLTATSGIDGPEAWDVLRRTARLLTGVSGTISYR